MTKKNPGTLTGVFVLAINKFYLKHTLAMPRRRGGRCCGGSFSKSKMHGATLAGGMLSSRVAKYGLLRGLLLMAHCETRDFVYIDN